MPRLRDLPRDFELRRRGFRSPRKSLEQGAGSESLVESYEIARRAGRAVAPVVKAMGLPLDYSTARGVRFEEGGIVLIADSAAQLARLRNMERRLLERLVAEGVPVTGLSFRLRARKAAQEQAEAPVPVRSPSIIAAAELREAASRLISPELREQILALARMMTPSPGEMPLAVLSALDAQDERLARLASEADALEAALPPAPDPKLLPSEANARESEAIADLRARMLARIERRAAGEAALRGARALLGKAGSELAAMKARAVPQAPGGEAFEEAEADRSDALEAAARDCDINGLAEETIAFSRRVSEALKAVESARDALEERARMELRERHDRSARSDGAVGAEAPAAPAAGAPQKLSPDALRKRLREDGAQLARDVRSARALVAKALGGLPSSDSLEATDGRLAREVVEVARARSRGEARPEARFSPVSTRRMLLWRDRDRIARRLCEIDAALAAIAGRLDADRPHLRAPRPNASASALAADFMALQSIDRRRAGDAADALRLSTEAETLAEAAGVLLAELPSEELAGESPEQTSLEAAAAAAERSIAELAGRLGASPNPAIIPTEAEAAADASVAALRSRQLARLSAWRERAATLDEARAALSAFRKVLHAPRAAPLDAPLAESLRKAADDALARLARAGEAIAPSLALPQPSLGRLPASPGATTRDCPEPLPSAEPSSGERQTAAEASEPKEAVLGEDSAAALLVQFATMPEVWDARLPAAPLEKLIPSERDAAADPRLAALRERMIVRLERRARINAMIADFRARLAEARELAANPLADALALRAATDALGALADAISAELFPER